ncbi:hypothetical protein CIHG_01413 [Coccidioides immitis H538.4]|uniref:Uncharacterized protein n=1 Tax=Coccidioides immitis H538.4 TaxID=396776 RepID=A0A0J8REM1_COCIT|nr:hypothetical protein CIHG_01413 [Coccidioides immitis H538.4]
MKSSMVTPIIDEGLCGNIIDPSRDEARVEAGEIDGGLRVAASDPGFGTCAGNGSFQSGEGEMHNFITIIISTICIKAACSGGHSQCLKTLCTSGALGVRAQWLKGIQQCDLDDKREQ